MRGLCKLRSFTEDPQSIFDYAPLTDENGSRAYKIKFKSAAKDIFVVEVDGITGKEAADQLRGDKIYIPQTILPKPAKGEYYEADLIGLTAVDGAGKDYGKVMGIHDHGAGVFLEIGTNRKDSFMLPFKDAFVPEVDVKGGKVVVVVPEEWV